MNSTFKDNINQIKEIYSGVYQIVLDFASHKIIEKILSRDYEYIWVHNHMTNLENNWFNSQLPISEEKKINVLARQVSFDFLIKTENYDEIGNELSQGVTLLQIKKRPPKFIDLKRLKGKTRYDLLKKECDYLFEINLRNVIDYGTLISSNKEFLEGLLIDENINWEDLP